MISLLKNGRALLIITPENRRYLTGFHSSLGYLLIFNNQQILLLDSRYFEAAKKSITDKNITLVLLKNIFEQLKAYIEENGIEEILVETENRYCDIEPLNDLPVNILFSSSLSKALTQRRAVKNETEVKNITKALRIAEKALKETMNIIKAGVTENEVAAYLEYKMKSFGSENTAFETIVLAGKRTSLPHGVPTNYKIKSGDPILLDFGATYNGYKSDITRTFFVNCVSDKNAEIYNMVLNANKIGFKELKNDVDLYLPDLKARESFLDYARYFTHSLGHGVGLEIHESPNLSPKAKGKLTNGNIVTVEPGLYFEGKLGIRIEDMVLITQNKAKLLTKFPKKLTVIK